MLMTSHLLSGRQRFLLKRGTRSPIMPVNRGVSRDPGYGLRSRYHHCLSQMWACERFANDWMLSILQPLLQSPLLFLSVRSRSP